MVDDPVWIELPRNARARPGLTQYRHDLVRVPRDRPKRRSVDLWLRIADVVPGLWLQREIARQSAWLPSVTVRLFAPLPRHRQAARAGHGLVPRRLLLGHGVTGAGRPQGARPRLPLAARDAQ